MTRKYKKEIEHLLGILVAMVGEYNTGLLLSILCDNLDNFVKGADSRNMRTIELIFNDFYSLKYDFEKEGYIDDNQ